MVGHLNLTTGSINISNTDISIGETGDGELSVTRMHDSFEPNATTALDVRRWFGVYTRSSADNYILNCGAYSDDETIYATVVMDGVTYMFRDDSPDGDFFKDGNQLNCATHTFIRKDGAVATAPPPGSAPLSDACGYRCFSITNVQYPNGRFINYEYENVYYYIDAVGPSHMVYYLNRLKSATNSQGFKLTFAYMASGGSLTVADRREFTITDITASRTQCVEGVVHCSAGALGQVHYTYSSTPYTFGGGIPIASDGDPAKSALQRLATVTDVNGGVTTYGYASSSSAFPQTIKGPTSVTPDFTFGSGEVDSYGNSLSVVGAPAANCNGGVVAAAPDICGKMIVRDQAGKQSTYYIGGRDRQYVASFVDEYGNNTTYDYDGYERLVGEHKPEGNSTVVTLDDRGNPTEIRAKAKPGSGLPDRVVTISYPACTTTNFRVCNQPASRLDPKGGRTDYQYDAASGALTSEIAPVDASGVRAVKRYAYQSYYPAAGVPIAPEVTSPLAYLRSYEDVCSVSSVTNLVPTSADFAYACPSANLTRTTYNRAASISSARTTFELSSQAVTADGSSRTTWFEYDVDDNLITKALPRSGGLSGGLVTTKMFYDPARRVIATTSADPDGTGGLPVLATRNTYDLDGNLTKVETGGVAAVPAAETNPFTWSTFSSFQEKRSIFAPLHRKMQETETSGGTSYRLTQFSYDAFGRSDCTAVRMDPTTWSALPTSACTLATSGAAPDPDRITKNVYDDVGRLVKVIKANGLAQLQQDYATYTYTNNGKQRTVKDADGNLATYTYDGFDRLIAWAFPSKTVTGASASCALGTVSEVNDVFGVPVVGPSAARGGSDDCERYAYDRNGNRAKLMKRDGSVIAFFYDALNRQQIKKVPTTPSGDVYFAYDTRGLQTSAKFGSAGGVGIANNYNGFGELSSTTNNMGTTPRTLIYAYDLDGNRSQLTYPDGSYFTYVYDNLDRLTATKEAGTTTIVSSVFDAQGRLSNQTRGAVTTTIGYDAVSRPNSWLNDLAESPPAPTSDVTSTFAYNSANQIVTKVRTNDAYRFTGYVTVSRPYVVNGLNQYTTAGTAAFTYDNNGNLIGDGSNTYSYDVENRMTSAATAVGAITLKYDPLGRLWQYAFPTKTWEYTYDGDAIVMAANSTTTVKFVHGPGDDDPMIQYTGAGYGVRTSLQADYQGSIVSAADATGAKLSINVYDEYGISPTTNAGLFQYTGQLWLGQLGLYYYKARMYSPTLGRFMQTDPIGYKDQNNLYTYVGDDPVDGRDPTGLMGDELDVYRPIIGGYADHVGTYIGNDKTGWTYISKDGAKNGGFSGPSTYTVQRYDKLSTVLADAARRNYKEAFWHAATPEQDKAAVAAAIKAAKTDYNGLTANCGDTVCAGRHAAGTPGSDATNPKDQRKYQDSFKGRQDGWRAVPLPGEPLPGPPTRPNPMPMPCSKPLHSIC